MPEVPSEKSSREISRRGFLRAAGAATGAAAFAGCRATDPHRRGDPGEVGTESSAAAAVPSRDPRGLPTRPLGRTGVRVPIIGMGTATAGSKGSYEEAVALFDESIDLGVWYMDTAPDFAGYGHAQRALGEVLERRRDEVFLVTKCWEPRGSDARALLERNLTELRTERADLVYAHSVGDDKMDPEVVMGKGGVLEFLAKAKEEGLTRFIGISGHSRPARFVEILRRFEIDVVMCAVNFVDRHTYGFETTVFPAAAEKGAALVAMKVFGGMRPGTPRALCGKDHHDLAFRYALGLPDVSLAVVGMKDSGELRENLERARRYRPLTDEERGRLLEAGRELSSSWGPHFGPTG